MIRPSYGDVRAILEALLNCAELNQDDLEPETRALILQALILLKQSKQVTT